MCEITEKKGPRKPPLESNARISDGKLSKDSDDDEVCNICYAFNPPELPNDNDDDID